MSPEPARSRASSLAESAPTRATSRAAASTIWAGRTSRCVQRSGEEHGAVAPMTASVPATRQRVTAATSAAARVSPASTSTARWGSGSAAPADSPGQQRHEHGATRPAGGPPRGRAAGPLQRCRADASTVIAAPPAGRRASRAAARRSARPRRPSPVPATPRLPSSTRQRLALHPPGAQRQRGRPRARPAPWGSLFSTSMTSGAKPRVAHQPDRVQRAVVEQRGEQGDERAARQQPAREVVEAVARPSRPSCSDPSGRTDISASVTR